MSAICLVLSACDQEHQSPAPGLPSRPVQQFAVQEQLGSFPELIYSGQSALFAPHCAAAKERYGKPGLSFCHLLSSVSSSTFYFCRHLLHIKTRMKHYCVILPNDVFELLDNYKHCKACTYRDSDKLCKYYIF